MIIDLFYALFPLRDEKYQHSPAMEKEKMPMASLSLIILHDMAI